MRRAVVAALLLCPAPAAALQATRSLPVPAADTSLGIRLGDAAHAALRPLDALQAYRGVLDADPDRFDALWKASREAVSLGMLAGDEVDGKRRYTEAAAWARHAVAVRPDAAEGHEWLAISLGRLALQEGPRTRVHLAGEIRATALRALEIDPDNAAAHHVLGEWHAEVRRLSGLTRWAARKLLGADAFDQASWEVAERHLRRAVELEPTGLIHHLALARALLDLDRVEEARAELGEVLARPPLEPTDPLHAQEARRLLERLRGG